MHLFPISSLEPEQKEVLLEVIEKLLADKTTVSLVWFVTHIFRIHPWPLTSRTRVKIPVYTMSGGCFNFHFGEHSVHLACHVLRWTVKQ